MYLKKQIPDIHYDSGFDDLVPYTSPLFFSGGGFFTQLKKIALPLFKRVKPILKRTAMRAVRNMAKRVSEGEDIHGALKRTAGDTLRDIVGAGGKKRRLDIFD